MECFIPQKGKIALQKTQKRGSESPLYDISKAYLSLIQKITNITDNIKASKTKRVKAVLKSGLVVQQVGGTRY